MEKWQSFPCGGGGTGLLVLLLLVSLLSATVKGQEDHSDATNRMSAYDGYYYGTLQLPRCCPEGETLNGTTVVCVPDPGLPAGAFRPLDLLGINSEVTVEIPVGVPECGVRPLYSTPLVQGSYRVHVQPNGRTRVTWSGDYWFTGRFLDDFCIDVQSGSDDDLASGDGVSHTLYGCYTSDEYLDRVCSGVPCIRKCFPEGQVCDEMNMGCKPADSSFSFPLAEGSRIDKFQLVVGVPSCDLGYEYLHQEALIHEDGSLSIQGSSATVEEYCLDNMIRLEDSSVAPGVYMCYPLVPTVATTSAIHTAALVVSLVLLMAEALCLLLVPELRQEYRYLTCLVVGMLVMVFAYILGINFLVAPGACSFNGLAALFGLTSIHSWLFVISAHFFVQYRNQPGWLARLKGTRQLAWFSVIGWGIPAVITGVWHRLYLVHNDKDHNSLWSLLYLECFFARNEWSVTGGPLLVLLGLSLSLLVSACCCPRIPKALEDPETVSSAEEEATASLRHPSSQSQPPHRRYSVREVWSMWTLVLFTFFLDMCSPLYFSSISVLIVTTLSSLEGAFLALIFFLDGGKRRVVLSHMKKSSGK